MSEKCPHAGKIASPGAAFFHYTPSGVNAGKIAIHNLFATAVVVDDLRAICQFTDSYRPDAFLTALPAFRGFVLVLVILVIVFLAIIIVVIVIVVATLSLPSVIATLTVVIVVATFSVIAAIIAFTVIATTASLSVIAIFGVCVGGNQ